MNEELSSLIKWLGTFELESRHASIEELSGGLAIAEALQQIAPEWFTPAWRSKLNFERGGNWRLKFSNLKKIVEAVMDHYAECLNEPLMGYAKPDAAKIAENKDPEELRRLLQLVLGCAVNCDKKQLYITRIMSLEECVQRAIMQSIQELEGSMHGPRLSLGASLNTVDSPGDGAEERLFAELRAITDLKDELSRRCEKLDQELSMQQEANASLTTKNERLQERLDEFEGVEKRHTMGVYVSLRKQIDDLKAEVAMAESSRDDYAVMLQLMEKEFSELQGKHDELQKTADQANILKDEVDALRETADRAAKYEATIESYKKKMEEMSDLRRQVKILEDKAMEDTELRITWEEETKKALLMKNHLEACKQQLAECHRRLDEQTTKCDKLEFEAKKWGDKVSSLQRERDRLLMEREALRETNEELRCNETRGSETLGIPGSVDDPSATEHLPHEWKEKMLLLQHEIKMLKLNNQTGADEKLATVQALLEDSEERLNGIRAQNRVANQRIIELENKLEEIPEIRGNGVKNDHQQEIINRLQEEMKKSEVEREQLAAQLEERENALQAQKQKVFTLQENFTRKELEANALEERYRKYVDKAKSVIRSLDPKQTDVTSSDVALLRKQLIEKQKIILDMERSINEARLLRQMEDNMMTTAFYHLGFACQREAVDQQLSNLSSSQGHSFLARQRQPASRRPVHPS